MDAARTAVVVDEWPLVRLGVAQALRSAGCRVVGESHQGEDGLRQAESSDADFLLLGAVRDAPVPELVRRAVTAGLRAKVIVLLDHVSRDELAALVSVGVDALLVRSLRPEELLDAIDRVAAGERVVGGGLMPLLVGMLGPPEEAEGAEEGAGALTRKELEVLARLAEGRSNREIADALFVTTATVKTHLGHIYAKLGVESRQAAVAEAVAQGLLT
ncbi:MAG: response regulator transcription factor [Actinobacteria bacterium]|nr:response regulator transcription factor [Actinomycetota bacterium]